MASIYIGVICGALTGTVYSVLNPDDDAELDNPRLLLMQNADKEPMRMVKVSRGDYGACLSFADLNAIIDQHKANEPLT